MFLVIAHNTNAAPALLKVNNSGNAGEVFNFPEDHVLHQPEAIVSDIELFLEWLYLTGELKDAETGDLYGIQYTLFNQNLKPGLIGYVNHAAISRKILLLLSSIDEDNRNNFVGRTEH